MYSCYLIESIRLSFLKPDELLTMKDQIQLLFQDFLCSGQLVRKIHF